MKLDTTPLIICRTAVRVLFFLIATTVTAAAHGTEGTIGESRGILVQAAYDDGDAMSCSETRVFHEPDTRPFQTGLTDRNGRFIFYPDGPGVWRVDVTDEMGHAMILKTDVTANSTSSPSGADGPPTELKPPNRFGGTLAGLGFIFLVSGVPFWLSGIIKQRKMTAIPPKQADR